jgi:hypothetical protein
MKLFLFVGMTFPAVDKIMPRSTRAAPMYPFKGMFSCANKNPNKAAKTGSNEKMSPVRAGDVNFWAIVFMMNPSVLQTIRFLNYVQSYLNLKE